MWDAETTFSSRQALADGVSDTIVDTGPDDIGPGEPVLLQVSLTHGASGDLTVVVESSENAAMASPVDRVSYLIDAARVSGAGTVLAAALPSGCGRYLRLRYSGATGGLVTAGLVQGAQTAHMA